MSPAPAILSRERIVDATIRVLDTLGVDKFSMRRLGAELGVDPMAVYYHFPTKAALFDAVIDSVWAGLQGWQPAADASWQSVVIDVFNALRRSLLTHPRLVPVVASRPLATPYMIGLTDRVLGELNARGLPPASAMRLMDCALAFTVGKLVGEVRQPVGGESSSPEQTFAGLSPQTHPHLVAALMDGYAWQPDEQFEQGLAALVYGWHAGASAGKVAPPDTTETMR